MDLQSSFVDDLLHAEDEYEVMALCYNKLLEYTQDSDVLFVAKIEHLEKDREFEPFAQEFENLRQILISYSQEINVHFNLDGTGFDIFKNRLIDELSSFQCPEQIDISRWFPVCLFYVLDALDGYISKNIGLVRDKYRTFGPLNQGRSKTNCLVYFHEQESFLSVSYAEKDGHGEFRRPLRETRIGNLFHAVLLIPREQIPIVPRIAPVFLNDYCKESLSESKKLNAVEGTSKKATGTIVVPRKQGTAMAAFCQKIIRKRNCTLSCLNHGGCIEQIEISFVESNPQVSLNKFKLK